MKFGFLKLIPDDGFKPEPIIMQSIQYCKYFFLQMFDLMPRLQTKVDFIEILIGLWEIAILLIILNS